MLKLKGTHCCWAMDNTRLAPPTFKYRAFISYSHCDRRAAEWLHKAIENYRIPASLVGASGRDGPIPSHVFPVFRDRDELGSVSDLSASIRDALAESAYLIVVCSPAAANSRWVNQEIIEFKRLGRADRIHGLIVDGEPGSHSLEAECFPPSLRFKLDAHGQLDEHQPAEPLAADMRPEGDGKSGAKLKLIAGLLGVSLNDLRKREVIAARRRARITQAITTSIALLAVAGGLAAWYALAFRNQSEERLVPGLRVDRRQTILDLSGWKETSDADIRDKVRKSRAVSNNKFTLVRTHDYAQKFIHIAGSTSETPPQVECKGCKLVRRERNSASRAPFEWNVEFDISAIPLDEQFDVEFQFIFWNAFQAKSQWWGGYRILHDTNVSVYTVQFPDSKHPLPDAISYYYVDSKEHPDNDDGKIALVKDDSGRVSQLTWEVLHPKADRSYRVKWDWSQ
jgi:MTH538 TIR-like domain (DUF1863)